ncbi:homocysteine methyltransferase [Burkholderia vietnamiensis]|uniref:homocysteine S-methyltransferase family protein n=1 Tax=Burkholderia vietnamiensis TaxID=60552 RepID=UPI00075AEBC7|nr:homocysteine S-methyltransferase family protein [Burkholderia vietnamiensis]KVE61345.1 homocysteine methyltransferase [Burkholderia vietnamiensis]HDR9153324.1 homocysteine S-methyltransferase family protein [Burkholderia vietnamiensis]HDR9178082.1 homocysteine S-methyltransferase family protein [Burkholderia vietnamiensis]
MIRILDGGMGRELLRMGAPFKQPEWSALALIEAPDYVRAAHEAFVRAGADVVTTNSYAVVPFHIGEERFAQHGLELADRAGRLAREAVANGTRPVQVAGSLPPLFGSYRPDLFDAGRAAPLLDTLIRGLAPHVDLWLGETLGSTAEARAIRTALGDDARPLWLSFTLDDTDDVPAIAAGHAPARLRSGESVSAAVDATRALNAQALLFNCSQAEIMKSALLEARERAGATLALGVYANAFEPERQRSAANTGLSALRADLEPDGYLAFAREWAAAGASLIGGCCGIGPEHIERLAEALRETVQ